MGIDIRLNKSVGIVVAIRVEDCRMFWFVIFDFPRDAVTVNSVYISVRSVECRRGKAVGYCTRRRTEALRRS